MRKTYGDRTIVDDISCSIEPNSRIVIIGPNGAGKSTLLKIMAGIEQPDAGYVTVAPSVVIGHLDQEQETLPTDLNVFEAYRERTTRGSARIESRVARLWAFHLARFAEKSGGAQCRPETQTANRVVDRPPRQFVALGRADEPYQFGCAGRIRESVAGFPRPRNRHLARPALYSTFCQSSLGNQRRQLKRFLGGRKSIEKGRV